MNPQQEEELDGRRRKPRRGEGAIGREREMEIPSEEALRYVWEGAIPLQIHLHESEVTTLPPPPPALVLGPRVGYLPLLVPLIKPHFSNALPPGVDTIWFDYKGLPLKWYIPTGVLFDILCAEPERPWNLTVHFRGYPTEVLTPCDGEDSVKWSFINSLKEAAYIINGNCKNVMNMSQADQLELWQSVMKGNMESYLRVSSRLKLGPIGEYCVVRTTSAPHPRLVTGGSDIAISNQTGRVAVRLYVRNVIEDLDDWEDATTIDSWDKISYINRPVEIDKEEGKYCTLRSAVKTLLPEFFDDEPSIDDQTLRMKAGDQADSSIGDPETTSGEKTSVIEESSGVSLPELHSTEKSKIKLVRIQGIEADWDIPLAWVVNNLMHPEYYLHISVFVGVPLDQVKMG